MQTKTNTQVLTQLGFFFGFLIALLLSIIYQINYLHLEKLDNDSVRVTEGLILIFASGAYLLHIILLSPNNLGVFFIQCILLLLLIMSGFHQEKKVWMVCHFITYSVSSAVWILHLLWVRAQKKEWENRIPIGI